MNEISIYQTENGTIEVRLEQDTVWLSQAQMVALFGRDQSVVSRHIGNIFKEGELDRESNMQKMHIANSDKPIDLYSLDVIISVGYRIKSQQGTRFRQWATRLLREHLTQGYTLNRQRLETNARELEAALLLVKKAAQNPELLADTGRGLVMYRTGREFLDPVLILAVIARAEYVINRLFSIGYQKFMVARFLDRVLIEG